MHSQYNLAVETLVQYRYDAKGNLIAEIDALGYSTEYLNSEDGLPHTIIDATRKSKYLGWNNLAQYATSHKVCA